MVTSIKMEVEMGVEMEVETEVETNYCLLYDCLFIISKKLINKKLISDYYY